MLIESFGNLFGFCNGFYRLSTDVATFSFAVHLDVRNRFIKCSDQVKLSDEDFLCFLVDGT